MSSYVLQDGVQRPNAKRRVTTYGDVMLTTLLGGEAHMTTCLPGDLIPVPSE